MTRRIIFTAALAATLFAGGNASAGSVQKIPATLTADYFCGNGGCPYVDDLDWIFQGRIDSPRRGCRADRRINIYAKEPGRDTFLGYGFSDGNRRWTVTAPFDKSEASSQTRYYAKATRKRLSRRKVCAPAKSNDLID